MAKKLVYDSSDADTLAASDFAGAHLYAGDTKLTMTSSGGKDALDVNIINAITVDLDGVYDVSDNPLPDNAGLIAHTRSASPSAVEQVERTTAGVASADDVVAANVHGLDVNAFNMIFDGTNWDRLRGTAGALNINDGGNSITVDDGAGSLTVDFTSDPALANVGYLATRKTNIADVEVALLASQLAGRKYFLGMNNSHKSIEIINPSGAFGAGFPIYPGVYQMLRAGPALNFKVIGPTGAVGLDFAVLELA